MLPFHFFSKVIKGEDNKRTWIDTQLVFAMPYDSHSRDFGKHGEYGPSWSTKAKNNFRLKVFNSGDYVQAVMDHHLSQNSSDVLSPNDNMFLGKGRRLKQQYFLFAAATLKDIIRRFKSSK